MLTNDCKEMRRIIKKECVLQGIVNEAQIAYVIATAEWETNHTCRPVREAYWLSEDWRKKHLRYYPYYGRGYVQLTWETNYKKFGKLLGIDLVNNPDRALEPEHAVKILVIGMRDGLFTGMSLDDCTDSEGTVDYVKARRIINGTDKDEVIASMAVEIQHYA